MELEIIEVKKSDKQIDFKCYELQGVDFYPYTSGMTLEESELPKPIRSEEELIEGLYVCMRGLMGEWRSGSLKKEDGNWVIYFGEKTLMGMVGWCDTRKGYVCIGLINLEALKRIDFDT